MKINQIISKLPVLLAFGALVTFTSCDDDDPIPVPSQPTVLGIAQSDTTFSILVEAVEKAGLTTALNDLTKSYTVFAPTNTAFRNAGITSSYIAALTPAQVASVLQPTLLYHVVGAEVKSTGVPVSDTVKTLNTLNLFASNNANGVFVNGIKVTTADLDASNGVVHVIGSVIIPPTQTITEIVVGNPNFSLLEAAVIRAGLAGALGAPGKYTVFAPVNSGFPAAYDTEAEINAATPAAMTGIVGAHAFGTNIFAGDLVAGNTGATLVPTVTLTIALTPPSVKITGSVSAASLITTTNIVATNGVIHVIDKVLL